MGAAVLADAMADAPDFWVSKKDYEESGARAVHSNAREKK